MEKKLIILIIFIHSIIKKDLNKRNNVKFIYENKNLIHLFNEHKDEDINNIISEIKKVHSHYS